MTHHNPLFSIDHRQLLLDDLNTSLNQLTLDHRPIGHQQLLLDEPNTLSNRPTPEHQPIKAISLATKNTSLNLADPTVDRQRFPLANSNT
jgi:hypothetical protein